MLPIRVQPHTKVTKVPWLPAQVVYSECKIGTDRQADCERKRAKECGERDREREGERERERVTFGGKVLLIMWPFRLCILNGQRTKNKMKTSMGFLQSIHLYICIYKTVNKLH